jgi:protease YdgD
MRLALCLIFALWPTLAAGQQGAGVLQALETRESGRGWQGVGRLNLGEHRFCTGTLVAPDRVLTAAHCLFHDGRRIPDGEIEFLAGWRNGRAEAIRGARRSVIAQGYDGTTPEARTLSLVARDLALVELDHPIRGSAVLPFQIATRQPHTGEMVAVVSYARERSERPSLEEACTVLDTRPDRVIVLNCSIDFGASGAPVFRLGPEGAQIVSVISALARGGGAPDGTAGGDPLAWACRLQPCLRR